MYKKILLLLVAALPLLVGAQTIYSFQNWADGGAFGKRIVLPHDSTDHRGDILFIGNTLYALGLDGFYHVVGSGAAQVQTDWTATSGISSILHKPNLSAVALSGAFIDLASHPSSLVDYGITDAVNVNLIYNNPDWISFINWMKVTGFKDDSTAAGFHTPGFYDARYGGGGGGGLSIADSTKYASFGRLYKTIDSLKAAYLSRGDSTQYATFSRLYKSIDSAAGVYLRIKDSAKYASFGRLYKLQDSNVNWITATLASKLTSGGDMAPLFTNTTTSGVLNFTPSNVSSYAAYGNFTSGTTTPSFSKIPILAMANNGAGTIFGFDISTGAPVLYSAGTGVSFAGNQISVTGGGGGGGGGGYPPAGPSKSVQTKSTTYAGPGAATNFTADSLTGLVNMDSARLHRAQADSTLVGRQIDLTNRYAVFTGNSIGTGAPATGIGNNSYFRWPAEVVRELRGQGVKELNRQVSGAVITSSVGQLIKHQDSLGVLFIQFGINEINAGTSAATFSGQLNTYLNSALIDSLWAGYPVVVTSLTGNNFGYVGGSNAIQSAYNDTIQAVALRRGCIFCDFYKPFQRPEFAWATLASLHPDSAISTYLGRFAVGSLNLKVRDYGAGYSGAARIEGVDSLNRRVIVYDLPARFGTTGLFMPNGAVVWKDALLPTAGPGYDSLHDQVQKAGSFLWQAGGSTGQNVAGMQLFNTTTGHIVMNNLYSAGGFDVSLSGTTAYSASLSGGVVTNTFNSTGGVVFGVNTALAKSNGGVFNFIDPGETGTANILLRSRKSVGHVKIGTSGGVDNTDVYQIDMFPNGHQVSQNGGTTVDYPFARWQYNTSTEGILFPRLSATQRNALTRGYLLGGQVVRISAAGTGYTTGAYANVAATGGSGTGLTVNVTVAGGGVTILNVTTGNTGTGYKRGDVISVAAANIGGTGSGFTGTIDNVLDAMTFGGADSSRNRFFYFDGQQQRFIADIDTVATMIAAAVAAPNLANIYLKDSTLSGDRTVSLAGHQMNFSGTSGSRIGLFGETNMIQSSTGAKMSLLVTGSYGEGSWVLDNSGTARTIDVGSSNYILDPVSVALSTFTYTLPNSGLIDGFIVNIHLGGNNITSGVVSTLFAISPASGAVVVDKAPPTTGVYGDYFSYRLHVNGSTYLWYREGKQ